LIPVISSGAASPREFELSVGAMSNYVAAALSGNGGLGYLAIHAVQFGAQPILAKSYIWKDTLTSSLVLGAELAKILGCLAMLHASGELRYVLKGYSVQRAVVLCALPASTYLVQNYCIQVAYQNIDSVVFNILNQSKMLFTAFFSFAIMGRRQSRVQCIALLMVTIAGILISWRSHSDSLSSSATNGQNGHSSSNGHTNGHNGQNGHSNWMLGVPCVVVASALSGLGSGLTEWIVQGQKRNTYLFSAEMAVLGCLTILFSLVFDMSPDSSRFREKGLLHGWTLFTLIPVLTQGLGGIIVGLITKTSGGVKKGFAVICGLLLTCAWKCLVDGQPLSLPVCVAVPMVGGSIYLHAKFPPVKKID
jgi:UDP-sugar transporter A1/2/3